MNRKPETLAALSTEETRTDRRRFLLAGAAALLAVLGGKRLAAKIEARRTTLEPVAPQAAADLACNAATSVGQAAGEAIVARLEDGSVVAFDRRCPHLGCPVVWAAARKRFECPCHHAAFDARTGAVLFGPPRRGLAPVALAAKENPT